MKRIKYINFTDMESVIKLIDLLIEDNNNKIVKIDKNSSEVNRWDVIRNGVLDMTLVLYKY